MLIVYRTKRSLRVGCIYKHVDVIAVRVWCLDTLLEDDVLTSKNVGANNM